jgi:hypothetical protein
MPLELFLQASPACARLARTIAGFVFEPSFGVLPCFGSIRLRRKKICVKRNFLLARGVVGCMVVARTSKQGDDQMAFPSFYAECAYLDGVRDHQDNTSIRFASYVKFGQVIAAGADWYARGKSDAARAAA